MLVPLIPGANQLLGLSNAVRYGTARAMAGVAGWLAAFVVLIGLVVAGLSIARRLGGTGVVFLGLPGLLAADDLA
ncbi:hypothetical protein AB0L65_16910 [Nonomuraea sp. NPDC052116]|uniref:hypothetical protein n=1 Tax=Nonomuraea sp. NPDC052116 TaxID=3155665 RepID=UPI0034386ABA